MACYRCVHQNINPPREVVAKGLCGTHYQQVRRYGQGIGSDPDELTAKYHFQINTRVTGFAQAQLMAEAERKETSVYDLVRDIIEEWAVKKNEELHDQGRAQG